MHVLEHSSSLESFHVVRVALLFFRSLHFTPVIQLVRGKSKSSLVMLKQLYYLHFEDATRIEDEPEPILVWRSSGGSSLVTNFYYQVF
jgi:hypothetical protein